MNSFFYRTSIHLMTRVLVFGGVLGVTGVNAALIDGPSGSILSNVSTTANLIDSGAGGATGPGAANALIDGVVGGAAGTFIEFDDALPSVTFSFNFDQSYDVSEFLLWNDRGVADAGIGNFSLSFFDSSNAQIGVGFLGAATVFQGNNPTAETFVFGSVYSNAVRVDLEVFDSLGGPILQVREIAFSGDASTIPVPGVVWLIGFGLVGLFRVRREA